MPIIPIDDRNPRIFIPRPYITWGMILACLAAYALQNQAGGRDDGELIYGLGVIPITLTGEARLPPELYLIPPYLTLFSYMFLHGGLMHLAGNMLFLWVFGDNVEDAMGHVRFLVFYAICGVVAAGFQILFNFHSPVPMIGASGAISGVLGAYLILHPRARVLVPIYFIPVHLPAWLLLIGWFAMQSYAAFTDTTETVAWWAHIGGFLAGVILVFPFRRKGLPLFGAADLTGGITQRDRLRWARQHKHEDRDRRGPWG
jgi:membrane associated rhomboid family serine protease